MFSGDKLAADPKLGRAVWGGDTLVELYDGRQCKLADVSDDQIRRYEIAAILVWDEDGGGEWIQSDAVREVIDGVV
jgi:hypothetical protein